MSKSMSKYRVKETVKARQVSEPETVVTEAGVNTVPEGSYIVERETVGGARSVTVVDADTFEAVYEPVEKPKPVKKAAPKPVKKALPAQRKR